MLRMLPVLWLMACGVPKDAPRGSSFSTRCAGFLVCDEHATLELVGPLQTPPTWQAGRDDLDRWSGLVTAHADSAQRPERTECGLRWLDRARTRARQLELTAELYSDTLDEWLLHPDAGDTAERQHLARKMRVAHSFGHGLALEASCRPR